MILQIIGSMLVWTYGVFFIVYAYREPPPALAWLFRVRVPILFGVLLAFVPDEHTIKVGRIGIGAFLMLVAVVAALRAVYHFFFGWA
jgi:hypothetical protein